MSGIAPLLDLQPYADKIKVVLTDIDGTLTDEKGRLEPAAFAALASLSDLGIQVIPVTGRPAGWCDAIIRQWPVDAVIGENGALVYWHEDGQLRRLYHPAAGEPSRAQERLQPVVQQIIAAVPGARSASDQAFRLFDLAIDFCEDPPDLGLDGAERIRQTFVAAGAHAKISNIHVNGWFGDYDKLSMTRLFLNRQGLAELPPDPPTDLDQVIYCGDSPNDEPMFEYFPLSVAVANIAPFLPRLRSPPRFITPSAGGQGFAEVARMILAAQGET